MTLQLLGIILALTTALNYIIYEKLVQHFSYTVVAGLLIGEMALMLGGSFFMPADMRSTGDWKQLYMNPRLGLIALGYILTGITGPIWYIIAKRYNLMSGVVYEMSYIILLTVLYLLFGKDKITPHIGLGLIFGALSVYFISRQ